MDRRGDEIEEEETCRDIRRGKRRKKLPAIENQIIGKKTIKNKIVVSGSR